MSPDELANLIEDLILRADVKYSASIVKVQAELYDQLLITLKDLEIDSFGYILQNNFNRKILVEAESKIYEVFQSSLYQQSVSYYVAVIPRIDAANSKYFNSMEGFKENRVFLKSLQNQTIKNVETYVLQDGLESQVINPLSQILNQNINSGGKFSGFLQQIRDYVKGNDQVEGRALSYSRTFLRDAMFTYSRTFQQATTADLGLVWYLYSGGLMDKSRSFCIERAGKFYHNDEIEKWAAETWQGKKSGTTESSIFLFAGGWNCGHSLIPVNDNIVPKEDLDRMTKSPAPSELF